MEELDKEAILVKLIKENCVKRPDGKYEEKKDLLCAPLFQELSSLYLLKKDEDKMNYIYSAGLLAAAGVRDSEHQNEYEDNMQNLWEIVLTKCQAPNRRCQLKTITAEIRAEIDAMRQKVATDMRNMPQVTSMDEATAKQQEKEKVTNIRAMLRTVNNKYISIMNTVSQHCTSILFGNDLPCAFAHVALGSLAREEVTVFSDFESMILLDDECQVQKCVEIFRWYAVLFQIVIISLGESPLRLLGIPALNDFSTDDESKDWFFDNFTRCGIQFDSNEAFAGVHPLGHRGSIRNAISSELIKPVSDMVGYVEEKYKNTAQVTNSKSHLSEVLVKSRLVSGQAELHNKYCERVKEVLDQNKSVLLRRITKNMREFDPLDVLCEDKEEPKLKELMYRTASLLISYVGSMLRVPGTTCFQIVDHLEKTEKLTPEGAHNLRYAFAIASEIRAKAYTAANAQVRSIKISDLIITVGEKSIVDFFSIIRSLWMTLYPIVYGKTCIDDKDSLAYPMQSKCKTALICIFSSLHLKNELQQTLSEWDRNKILENDPCSAEAQNVVPFSKLVVVKLIKVFRAMVEMIGEFENTHSDDDNDHLNHEIVEKKCKEMMKALNACKQSMDRRHDSSHLLSPERIAQLFATQGYLSFKMDNYIDAVHELQKLVKPYIKDSHLICVLPDLSHVVYRIADFTGTLQNFNKAILQKVQGRPEDCNIDGVFIKLDHICRAMNLFKQDLNNLISYTPTKANAQALVKPIENSMDDGFFAQSDLFDGLDRWYSRVKYTKQLLMKLDEFASKAVDDKNLVFTVIFGILDWSFIISCYCKVLRRDVNLAIGDVINMKAIYYYNTAEYGKAAKLFQEVKEILSANYREKNHFRRKVANNIKWIALSSMKSQDYQAALSLFREELAFRLKELFKRTSTEEMSQNFLYQAQCLQALQKFEEANLYTVASQDLQAGQE